EPGEDRPVLERRARLPRLPGALFALPPLEQLGHLHGIGPHVALPVDADEPLAQFGLGLLARPAVALGADGFLHLFPPRVPVLDPPDDAARAFVADYCGTSRHVSVLLSSAAATSAARPLATPCRSPSRLRVHRGRWRPARSRSRLR